MFELMGKKKYSFTLKNPYPGVRGRIDNLTSMDCDRVFVSSNPQSGHILSERLSTLYECFEILN